MTQSIFDPSNPDAERGRGQFLGPLGVGRSHMSSDLIDGAVGDDAAIDHDQAMQNEQGRQVAAQGKNVGRRST